MNKKGTNTMNNIIRYPKELLVDYSFNNNAYVVTNDFKFGKHIEITLDHPLIIIGNVEAHEIRFVSKCYIYGDLTVSGTIVACNPLVVEGKIKAGDINTGALIQARSIESAKNIVAKNIICRGTINCEGNIKSEYITYSSDVNAGKCIDIEDHAMIDRNMVAGENIKVGKTLTVGGNINAKNGRITVECVSAGTVGLFIGAIICQDFIGNIRCGKLQLSRKIEMSMREIKAKLGIDPNDCLIVK